MGSGVDRKPMASEDTDTKQLVLCSVCLDFTAVIHYDYLSKLIVSQITDFPGKTCVEPVPTAHCSMTYTTHFVGDTVTYQCHHGYHFKNPSHPATLVCLDQPAFAVWSDIFPVCVRAFRIFIRSQSL